MCFSATADFAAAAVLAPVGVLALRSAPSPRDLPIAALPALFAVHQGIEGLVWLGTDGRASDEVAHLATVAYLVIAQVVLPLLVPAAMWLVEPDRRRRAAMAALTAIGMATAARFVWILVDGDVGAHAGDHVMIYDTDIHIGLAATAGYLVATLGPALLSSRPYLQLFGVLNVVGVSAAAVVAYEAVTSVWCVYAAFASVCILLHLRRRRAEVSMLPTQGATAPASGLAWIQA